LNPSLTFMQFESPGRTPQSHWTPPVSGPDRQAPLKQWLIKITKFYMLNIMWLN